MLAPKGRLAIVLPDSIPSNPGLLFIRQWIFKKFWVIASIDLPVETFEPFTGTQTTILLLQKKTVEEEELERRTEQPIKYKIFMSIPEKVGHDRRGHKIYVTTDEGAEILVKQTETTSSRNAEGEITIITRETEAPIVDDQLPEVVRQFELWWKDNNRIFSS